MRNLKIKKFISTVLALSLLLCTWVSAYADSDVPQPDVAQIENADLFVTEEVAEQLALLFIRDMSESGVAAWDETTEPTRVVPMYDETGENITAYTVELTAGYVVVSAYVDVPNLFFEWADEAEPVYADLVESPAGLRKARGSAPSTEKVVYVGPLGYYLDNGTDTLLGEEGEEVPREALSNDFDEFRDIENVTPEAIEMIVESKEEAAENGGISLLADDNTIGGYITNSVEYAKYIYGANGRYECTSWNNKWESAAHFATDLSVDPPLPGVCGPVAITNAIKMYGNKYNHAKIKEATDWMVFDKIEEANSDSNEKYCVTYKKLDGTRSMATLNEYADEFIVKSFEKYGVKVRTYGEKEPYKCTLTNIKNATTADRLMYVMLKNYGEPYGSHAVIGYAWACLTEKNTLNSIHFLKICDGHAPTARCLDVTRLKNDKYWEIKF